MNEDSASCNAALTLVKIEANLRLSDGNINVSIIQNDVSRFATKLKGNALQVVLVGMTHDLISNFCGSSKSDLINIRVLSESLSSSWAITWKNVNNTFGEASFQNELADTESSKRSLLSRLQHNCVTGSKSRSEFPCHHQSREVPWDDLGTDTDGLLFCVAEVRSTNGDGLTVNLVSPASVVSKSLDNQVNVCSLREADRLAVIESLKSGELILVLLDEVSKLVHQASTFSCGDSSPRTIVESLAGSLDSLVDIFNVGLLH